ncbi:MAG: biotin/lipoate A/B protein ligase family protein [Candidatus Micrarchaeota archaeon]
MRMRLLEMGANNAFMNMGIDEALMSSEEPVLRLYAWSPPAVSVGYFQKVEEEVDEEACARFGVDVVRRQTGGGAVFHENELTYSFITREHPQNILESYKWVCGALIEGLGTLGVRAEFAPLNDIVVGGKKISGNAQTRRRGVMLQHGTVLLGVDVEKMFSLLKVPSEKMKGKLISDVKARVSALGVSFEEAREAVKKGFERSMNAELVPSELTEEESEKAIKLAEGKYKSGEWLHRI